MVRQWMRRGMVVLLLAMLVLAACDTGPATGSGDGDGGDPTFGDLDALLGAVVGSIGMNLPSSLASTGGTLSARALDYSALPDVDSDAYEYLLAHLETMDAQITNLKDALTGLKDDIIAGSDLQPDEVYEESFEATGETIRIKYSWQDVGDTTYLVVESGTFDTATDALKSGSYMEVEDLGNDEVAGQVMYTGVDTDSSFKAKFDFDSSTGYIDGYYEMTNPVDGDESGQVRVIPDTEDTANGVEVAVKFEGEFGVHTQLGWANDNYGGVVSVNDPDTGSSDDEGLFTEIFAVDGGTGNVVFVEVGQKEVDVLFERVYRGRQALTADPSSIVNAYSASYTPPVDADGTAPDNLTLTFTWTPSPGNEDPDAYQIYDGLDTTGTQLVSVTGSAMNPEGIWEIYWLGGSGSTLQSGDAVFYLLSYELTDDGAGTFTGTAQFYKVAEVPSTIDMFGETGFYVQGATPLKYVTGEADTAGDTLIERYELDYDNDGNSDEFAYYVDVSGDGTFNPFESIQAGNDPDVPLNVWGAALDDSEAPFILGPIPEIAIDDGAGGTTGLTYEFESQLSGALGHLDEIAADQHISTITVPLFPVDGSDWKDISASDF